MTGLGIQAWVLPLIGIRSTFAHHEIMGMLEVLHILGNSYRLASSGRSSVVYGRFTLGFCGIIVAGAICNLRRFWAGDPFGKARALCLRETHSQTVSGRHSSGTNGGC